MKPSTLAEFLPALTFIGTLLFTRNFQLATWVLVAGSAIALAVVWVTERRISPVLLFSGVLALIAGGLTLIFHDARFVKMKMTIVDVALAVALFAGLALKKNPLKAMMGETLVLPDFAWRNLTVRYALFFLACAGVNEYIWRTQSDETWGVWRLVALGAALVFSIAMTPYLMKHMAKPEEVKVPDPPDAGF